MESRRNKWIKNGNIYDDDNREYLYIRKSIILHDTDLYNVETDVCKILTFLLRFLWRFH